MNDPSTPGPWEWREDPHGWSGPRLFAGDVEVLSGGSQIDNVGVYASDADTRLIAAAPDLLAACEAALAVDEWDPAGAAQSYLRAAVAKAKGISERTPA